MSTRLLHVDRLTHGRVRGRRDQRALALAAALVQERRRFERAAALAPTLSIRSRPGGGSEIGLIRP